jgi:hypothetical protein
VKWIVDAAFQLFRIGGVWNEIDSENTESRRCASRELCSSSLEYLFTVNRERELQYRTILQCAISVLYVLYDSAEGDDGGEPCRCDDGSSVYGQRCCSLVPPNPIII